MRAHGLQHLTAPLLLLVLLPHAPLAQTDIQRTIQGVGDLLQQGESKAAIEQLHSLGESAEGVDRARVSNALGYTLFSAGKEQEALVELEAARALAERENDHETLVKATNNLGLVHFTLGDLSAAREAFNESAAMGSGFARDYLGLIDRQEQSVAARALIDEGVRAVRYEQDFATAEKKYTEALEIDPENAEALDFRGYARFRLGDLDAAAADLERALSLQPERPLTKLNRLKVYCAREPRRPIPSDLGPATDEEASIFSKDGELFRVCGERLDRLLG